RAGCCRLGGTWISTSSEEARMATGWQESLFVACFLGLGGALLGLVGLLRRAHTNRLPWASAGLAVVLVGLAATVAALGYSPGIWQAPLLLAGACAASAAVRTPLVNRAGTRTWICLRNRRCQALALFVVTPLGALCWIHYRAESDPLPPLEAQDFLESFFYLSLEEVLPYSAATDGGRPVRLFRCPPESALPTEDLLGFEQKLAQARH